jgi:hypothetical protein
VLDAALLHHVGVMICIGLIDRHGALVAMRGPLHRLLDNLCCYLCDGLIDTLSMIVYLAPLPMSVTRNEAPLTSVFVSKV